MGRSARSRGPVVSCTWRLALVVFATLTACWVLPALARADNTVTLGPPLKNVGAAGGCPTHTTTPPADEPYYDCSYVATMKASGVVAQAPADGTITSWSVAFWNGTADLVIVRQTPSGQDEIVAKSAQETEPCIPQPIFGGEICNPQKGVFTYKTNLPVKKGDFIGIEGISAKGCGAVYFNGGSCFMVGFAGSATSQYWNQTPALNTPTPYSNDGGQGESSGIALDAVEDLNAKTVSVALSPTTITADGQATTTATATVTDNGKPVPGEAVTIDSSDGGQTVGPVTDDGDGTYTATITSSETVGDATITATDTSDTSAPPGTATLTQVAPTVAVAVSPTSIAADGKAKATATVRLTGAQGEAVPGQTVAVTTTGPASAGPVTDNGDGTYTSEITSTSTAGSVTVTGTDTSVSPNASADATLMTTPTQVAVSLAPAKITADGLDTTTATATVTNNGNPVVGDTIAITSSDPGEKVGAVTDNGDGTYTATVTASETVGSATITGTDTSDVNLPSGTAMLAQAPPSIAVSVTPSSITANGKATATATVVLTGVGGQGVPGQNVTIAATGPAFVGLVSDKGGGTYQATITASHSPGASTVTGTDGSVQPNVSGTASLTIKPIKTVPKKKKCIVPGVVGKPLGAAKAALKGAHCGVGAVTIKASKKVAKGHVISSRPGGGSKHPAGTRVNLTVSGKSTTPKKKMCVVPNLKGRSLATAKKEVRAAHCGIGKVSFKPSGKLPKGQMLSWKPGTGSKHPAGTKIALTVSSGAGSTKKMCVVPNLKGRSLATAKKEVRAAHCGIGKVSFKPSGKLPKGQMLSWKPGTGSKHPVGTKIALTVSSGAGSTKKMCVVPNLKGRSLATAKKEVRAAHCGIGKVSFKPSGKLPKGQMLSWKPGTGSKHPADTKIDLTVSKGR